jgi:uncharacterized protein YkwD
MPRRVLALSLFAVCAAVASHGTAAAGAVSCGDASTPVEALSIDQFERSVVCITNQRRADAGRPPVRPNATLARAAARHSEAMVSGRFFSHLAPGGRGLAERARASGYVRGAARWRVGENLRWAIRELSTPSEVVEAWMVSQPHRRVLLDDQFREIGIGAVLGAPVLQQPAGAVTVTALYGLRTK